ncbi:MAG: hypothetical protein L3K18_08715 [Thermoplasmata archaeon]|nr:hypothetical protein [Thermoplasmata archaeon]
MPTDLEMAASIETELSPRFRAILSQLPGWLDPGGLSVSQLWRMVDQAAWDSQNRFGVSSHAQSDAAILLGFVERVRQAGYYPRGPASPPKDSFHRWLWKLTLNLSAEMTSLLEIWRPPAAVYRQPPYYVVFYAAILVTSVGALALTGYRGAAGLLAIAGVVMVYLTLGDRFWVFVRRPSIGRRRGDSD